jgi:hypothetical protein
MAITYTQIISNMVAYPTYETQADVVFQINWVLVGIDDVTKISANMPAQTTVTYVAGEPFTPYNQLTQAEVLDWVNTNTPAEYMTALQTNVAAQIAQQTQQQTLQPPWVQPPTPPTT